MKLSTTKESARMTGVKVCVYGGPGAGKTRLCATTGGSPIIISAEGGLLSLRDVELPVIEVGTMDEIREAYQFLADSAEGAQFDWVCIDSISEIAEVVLAAEKRISKDPRQAYGALQDVMAGMIRSFRDLPRNVYMSAKMERTQDDNGAALYSPSMPGAKLGQSLGFFFDELLCLRVDADEQGKPVRWLQTQPDPKRVAKDRSGCLDAAELPDLGAIAAKILNH
jgi:phage nucleotide-binding protein